MSKFITLSDWQTLIAHQDIPGAKRWTLFGSNSDIDKLSTPETIWEGGGLYTFPSALISLEVVSNNANDTLLGTGARTVLIEGLDINYNSISAIVNLNGTTAVGVGTQFFRINTFTVIASGSTNNNIGTLTLRIAGGGATKSIISATQGFAKSAVYTVPAGYSLLIYTATFSTFSLIKDAISDGLLYSFRFKPNANVKTNYLSGDIALTAGFGAFTLNSPFPVVMGEKTDIDVIITAANADNLQGHVLAQGFIRSET